VLPVDRPIFPDAQRTVAALDTAIRSLAHQPGVRVLDASTSFLARHPLSRLFRHSGGREVSLHPNDTGYRVLAVVVYQALGYA
jgi:hypothetical protein